MPGEELVSTLKTFVEQNKLQGAFILSCVGSVTRVKLRMADSQKVSSSNSITTDILKFYH